MTDDKFSGLRKAVRVGYQVSTDEIRALLEAYDALVAPQAEPAKAHAFFRSSGIIDEHGGLTPEYGGQSMTGAQMEAATVSNEASQERAAIAYRRGYDEALNDCIRNGGEAWARSMFADQGEHIKPQEQAEPVAWGQLGMMNGKTYLRQKYDREPYPPPPDVVRNLNLVPLWTNPPAAEVQQQAVDLHRLKVAARAVTTAVYDRERLFAVTDLRAALDAMGE